MDQQHTTSGKRQGRERVEEEESRRGAAMLKVVGASWFQTRVSTGILALVGALGVIVIILGEVGRSGGKRHLRHLVSDRHHPGRGRGVRDTSNTLGVIVIILGEVGRVEEDGNYSATVYWSTDGGFRIDYWGQGNILEDIPQGAARAYYRPQIDSTGGKKGDQQRLGRIAVTVATPGTIQAAETETNLVVLPSLFCFWAGLPSRTDRTVRSWAVLTLVLLCRWAVLEVESHEDYPDWVQAYSAGLLEGSLSWQLIHWHWVNTVRDYCLGKEHLCKDVRRFIRENFDWVRSRAKKHMHRDHYWHQTQAPVPSHVHLKAVTLRTPLFCCKVELFFVQLDGLEIGWRQGVKRSRQDIDIPHEDFLWMNAVTDVADLERKFNGSHKDPNPRMSDAAIFSSAFVRLLPETKQLFVAHNTGARYEGMLRLMKRYELNYHLLPTRDWNLIQGRDIVFSSYPGVVYSQDDFYVVSGEPSTSSGSVHKLVVTGTAVDNYNKALWDAVDVEQVLIGPRVMAANRLAHDGKSWSRILARFNSGTGNKQWMVANYGQLETLRAEELLVEERLPSLSPGQEAVPSIQVSDGTSTVGQELPPADAIQIDKVVEPKGSLLWLFGTEPSRAAKIFAGPKVTSDENRSVERARGVKGMKEERVLDVSNALVPPVEEDAPISEPLVRHRRRFSSHKGLLWVVEQLPGLVQSSDQTHVLHDEGHLATFGVPLFKDIQEASSSTMMQQHLGLLFSLKDSPKARVFIGDYANATDLPSVVRLMRRWAPEGVAGRGDLFGTPYGTTDCKIFEGRPGGASRVHAMAGPPQGATGPFKWSTSSFSERPHVGQPDVWKFDMLELEWVWG
uniref:Phospholipase B-like n=1 Tax=Timema monikensis TaxID=170555 RepID=A0A7R9E6M1_9NEOP|nr:unnamed protein product [Timema monikensis]